MAFQGASLRGPYKRWIPQSDPLLSESETEVPKRNTTRPHAHHPPSAQAADVVPVPVDDTLYSNIPHVPTARNPASSSSRYHMSSSQQYRPEQTQYGYSSESTIHAPLSQLPTKPTSTFGSFRPHIKEAKVEAIDAHRREDHRSTATPASSTRTSQPQSVPQARSNSRDVSTGAGGAFGSSSTSSSADPSPRASTDGHQNGNVSASQSGKEDSRKQPHAIWNPYVDAKLNGSSSTRKPDRLPVVSSSRRTAKKVKDREDMVANVTEALGGGSTGRAKVVEMAMLQGQFPVRGEDSSLTRKTTSTIATTRILEGTIRTQSQTSTTPHRQKPLPPSNPYGVPHPSIPEADTRSSRPSTNSSRSHAEQPHYAPAPESMIPSSTSKHSRTAASPWPFNQALPVEPPIQKQLVNRSSGAVWKPFSRRGGVPASSKPPADTPTTSTLPKPADMRSTERTEVSSEQVVPPDSGHRLGSLHPPTKSSHRSSNGYPLSQKSPDNVKNAAWMWQELPILPTHNSGRGVSAASAVHSTKQSPNAYQSYPTSTRVTSQPSIPVAAISTQDLAKLKIDGDLLWSPPAEQAQQASMMMKSVPNNSPTPRLMKRPTPPDTLIGMTGSDERHAQDTDTQAKVAYDRLGGHRRVESTPQMPWPTASKQSTTVPTNPIDQQPPVCQAISSLLPDVPGLSRATLGKSTPPDQNGHVSNVSHVVWQPPARHQSSTSANLDTSTTVSFMTNIPQSSSTAGAWTTTQISHSSDVFASLDTQQTSRSNPPTPPTADVPESTKSALLTADCTTAGAWTNSNRPTVEAYDDLPTPKPPPKSSLQPVDHSSSLPAKQGLSYKPTFNPPVAGAWTVSNKLTTSSVSIFDSIPDTKLYNHPATGMGGPFSTRDTTLGVTTPAVGAWTTKTLPVEQSQTSLTLTPRPSPPRNSSTPSPVQKLPTPSTGTGTGTSTPSSAELVSSTVLQSTSNRVPISGHPSTPAPVRHTLRPPLPPLSISSTCPDTDSLLTPSSLNSPRSTLMIAQPQTPAAISAPSMQPPEKEKKSGFLDFFRPKPPVYEIWTPPIRGKDKDKERKQELSKNAPFSVSKPKPIAAAAIPRPKSPKFFSPLKLFSRRRRTVSSASLDALDGTTTAVLNSPASSMRADTPGAPPSPPLRDAFLATEEWRNRENSDLQLSGRKRRPRPGVTFDCPEDIAPVNIVPKRYRRSRSPAPEQLPDGDD